MNTPTIPSRRRRNAVFATLLASAAFQGMAYADLLKIGINFIGRDGTPAIGIDEFAGVVPQADWNNLGNNLAGEPAGNFSDPQFNNLTSAPLFTDNGIAGTRTDVSAVTITLTANDSWRSDENVFTTPDERLMRGIVKDGSGGGLNTPATVVFNNLDPSKYYTVIAYGNVNGGGNTAKVDYALGGATTYDTFYHFQPTNFDGTFTLGTNTAGDANRTQADYVQWSNVSPTAGGQFNFSWTWQGNGDGAGLSGFQVLEIAGLVGTDRFWNVGAGTGVWDNATMNWRDTNVDGASNATFATDHAVFGDLGTAGARTVTVDAAGVSAASITFNNSVGNNYTIEGGSIGGQISEFLKDGAGTVTITNTNTFGGKATIKHGTVSVATIGGVGVAGALGTGAVLQMGDTAGAADAKLNYTGGDGTWSRAVTMVGMGGEIAVTNGAATVTLTGELGGDGMLRKTGPGALEFSSLNGNFTGDLVVVEGDLSVAKLGSAAKSLIVANAASFAYTGATMQDQRALSIGAGGGTVSVQNAGVSYKIGSATATDGALTVGGAGRLAVSGVANFTAMPTIAPGATLALTNEAGTNVLPALTVPAGTLELAPGSYVAASTIDLTGGTLRLGQEGLLGNYFGGGYDQGQWQTAMAGLPNAVLDSFGALGTPAVSALTTTGGRTALNFANGVGANTAPFADQGFADADNVRTYFIGKILITNPGDTTFFTTSDDGSSLYIDGVRVVNNNAFQGMTERQGTINLGAGLHDIVVTFHEGGGGAGLDVRYTPAGGTKQFIPNSVLFSGAVLDSPTTNIDVSESSGLEITHQQANLGTLTLAGTKTLSLNGRASFATTELTGAVGEAHGVNVTNVLGIANLGNVSGTTPTIAKSGPGALLLSGGTLPAGTTIQNNAGLVVLQALNDGTNPQTDPLFGATIAMNGGGLGFSAAAGSTAPLTYANNVATAGSYTIGAGRFGSGAATATINWSPANGAVTVNPGATASFDVRSSGYVLNVTAPVGGGGAVSVEEGVVNFTSTTGVTAAEGFTVRGGAATVTGPLSTGALVLTGNYAGVGTGQFNTPGPVGSLQAANVTSATVSNAGGALTVAGTLTNAGAFTHSLGNTTLQGAASTDSLAVSGGNFTSTGTLNIANAVTVSGGAANFNGPTNAKNILINGTGTATVRHDLTTTDGVVVDEGRTLTLDQGAGTSRSFASGITVKNQSTLVAASGTTDFGSGAVTVEGRVFSSGVTESLVETSANPDVAYVLGEGRAGQPTTGGLQSGFRLGNSNVVTGQGGAGWDDNDLWVYTGQFYDADGIFSFAENIDDNVRVRVDGVLVLSNNSWNTPANTNSATNNTENGSVANTTGNYGMGPEGNGWHNIEVRFRNGSGGAGAVENTGLGFTATRGFVFSPSGNAGTTVHADSTDFIILNDPGDASVLRTVSGGGYITIQPGATIAAASTSGAQVLQMNSTVGNPAALRLHSNAVPTASDAATLRISGADATTNIFLGDDNSLTVGSVVLTDGTGNLVIEKADVAGLGGRMIVSGALPGTPGVTPSNIGAATVDVRGAELRVNAPILGTGSVIASLSGTVSGTGSIQGMLTAASGAKIVPGSDGIGALTVGSLDMTDASLVLEIDSASSYDQLVVSAGGTLSLGGTLSVSFLGGNAQVGDVFYIINNLGSGLVANNFNGIADGDTLFFDGGYSAQISYDALFDTNFESGGNDVALQLVTVPEPGAALALLSGLGVLMGFQRFRRRQS